MPAADRAVLPDRAACAQRYDRTTGYFRATALAIAARGIEGLVLNCRPDAHGGRLHARPARGRGHRARAVAKGHRRWHAAVDAARKQQQGEQQALELLAWMVARGTSKSRSPFLATRTATPWQSRRHLPREGRHHRGQDRQPLAFAGSINETAYGWLHNWESFHVFCDWDGGAKHVDAEERTFAQLWADKAKRAKVLDVPSAVREDLLRFIPPDGQEPERLEARSRRRPPEKGRRWRHPTCARQAATRRRRNTQAAVERHLASTAGARRRAYCRGDQCRHALAASGSSFQRMLGHWPPRLLIADEVGLGKTIEAGMVLRYAWLSGRAKRILVLAPKAVMTQWQLELREKFNLNWPIYDGKSLKWYPSPLMKGHSGTRGVSRRLASRALRHRIQPPDAPARPPARAAGSRRARGTWSCSTRRTMHGARALAPPRRARPTCCCG
jgi:hypothetical protein